MASGLALTSLIQTWWQLYLSYGVLTAIGLGACGWVPSVILAEKWFPNRVGTALDDLRRIADAGLSQRIDVLLGTLRDAVSRVRSTVKTRLGFGDAAAIVALEGKLDQAWARWTRPWTTVAWAFLSVGIGLGSWWAYYELGWGGYWLDRKSVV